MKGLKIFILALGFIIFDIPAFADTLYLKDGRVYTGRFMKGDKNGVQFNSDDVIYGFPIDSVSFISVGKKGAPDREENAQGKGFLKGIVNYRNTDSRVSPDLQPDFGSKVFACKLKVDNILIFYKMDELLRSGGIDYFIKDYMKYRWAKRNRSLLSKQNLNHKDVQEILKEKQTQLKRLGADTEEGWEQVKNRGRAVFSELNRGEIASRIAIAEMDGSFSFQLPAGFYFLMAQSQKSGLEDTYTTVKISDQKTTQISLEIMRPK